MKRSSLCVLLALLVVIATTGPAGAAIEITKINFNPDGRDAGSDSHVNREWILITNTGKRRKSLDGWRLHDKGRDHTYRFRNLALGPDEYVRLRSGRGEDTVTTGCNGHCFTYFDFFWGTAGYVWENRGDVATLRRRGGSIADRCRYGSAASSPKRC